MAGWLRNVIGRPHQVHGAKTPQEYIARAVAYRKKVAKLRGVPADLTEDVAPVFAYVSDSRWIVDCRVVGCNGGASADPQWRLAICFDCGSIYRNVVLPVLWRKAETILLKRPHYQNRHFFPFAAIARRYGLLAAERIEDLETENALKGLL